MANACQVAAGSMAGQSHLPCVCSVWLHVQHLGCDALVIVSLVFGQSCDQRGARQAVCEAGLVMTEQDYSRPCHS